MPLALAEFHSTPQYQKYTFSKRMYGEADSQGVLM